MSIPFIDLSVQHRSIRKELRSAVSKVFDSQRFILGRNVAELEARFTRETGAKYAVGLASGTDALYLALLALGIGPGDEVLTTAFSFFATAGTISRTGAKPVFVDIDPDTFNLDPKKISASLTKRSKAVVPVHLFGLLCDMNAVLKIAKAKSLMVVEDAAQAYGAQVHGKKAGSMGDAGCFSFYPTKNLGGAGDGGMLTTSSFETAEKVRILRDHGSRKKYIHEEIGTNSRLDEIQAAVLLVKLKYIDRWNALRKKHAEAYNKAFQGLPLQTPQTPKGYTHVFHLYSIVTEKRDLLADYLKKEGIHTGVYYPLPLHLQPCYRSLGYKKGDLPVSEHAVSNILSLPMYPELSQKDREAVCRAIRKFFGRNS